MTRGATAAFHFLFFASLFVLVPALLPSAALADNLLGIPATDENGSPLDVGLLILGHSTSAVGDYPAKLQSALEVDPADGRNYVVFRNITSGDGGFLWSRLSLPPSDVQYDRIQASQPQQYCEDTSGVRWSCRRLLVERALSGSDPAPTCCAGAQPPNIPLCVWHENGQRFEQPSTPFLECWRHMDVRLALVQDTTNRSWPVDDSTGDGQIGADDYFPSASIPAAARPCNGTSGVVGSSIDWNCDGQLDLGDTADLLYSRWLETLGNDLLNNFGADGVDHVLYSAKPIEMGSCLHYPGEGCCGQGPCDLRHLVRTPTPSRPFARYYLPTVYWEHRGVALLAQRPGVDPRLHLATPWSSLFMWQRSTACYQGGVPAGDWSLPAASAHPVSIIADDLETDGVNDDLIGCIAGDHVHHTNDGGWSMADVWYQSLSYYLHDSQTLFSDSFESGDLSVWSSSTP